MPIRSDHSRTRLHLIHPREESRARDEARADERSLDEAGVHSPSAEENQAHEHQFPTPDALVAAASPVSTSRGAQAAAWQLREDAELVVLARAGDTRAFEELYRRHSAYVLSLAIRVQGHGNDAQDVVHDAFLRVHDRLGHLRSGDAFRPWLASVVVSLVRTRMRRRRLLTLLGLSTGEPIDLDALMSSDADPEARAQLAQVYATLTAIGVQPRICWTLRYVEGHKLEEVARLAECSLATAKRRIALVQEKLIEQNQLGLHKELSP